ncbi:MAG: polyisoprenoid-binding protein [Helicobacteraceae bacterium]|nr:polyisoprenoid-binding protein [Helicobacteraceae bacterium]
MKTLPKLTVGILLSASALFAGTYSVDTAHSNVGFKVKHMMVSTVNGEFQKFSGSFELEDKTNKLKALTGTIEVASINTNIDKRDAHLKSEEIFNAAEFPNITFVLDSIKGDKAHGKLTIKGVTKDVALDYEFGGIIQDPWGNTRTGITLSGKIDRKEFGVNWNKILEAGGVAVSEEVKLEISLAGILQK